MSYKPNRKQNRKVRLYLFLSFSIMTFTVLIVCAYRWRSEKKVQSLAVEGNFFIPQGEIKDSLSESLLNSDEVLSSVKSRVKENPFVQATYISHSQPEVLNIEIKEKRPVAITIDDYGTPGFIDNYGETLPYKNYEQLMNLPIVRGMYNLSQVDSSALKGFLSILAEIEKRDKFLKDIISEIIYDKKGKTFSMLTDDMCKKVLFGDLSSIDLKILKLSSFIKSVYYEIDLTKIDYIDLRWGRSVVLKNVAS